jgi:hypothetical protein
MGDRQFRKETDFWGNEKEVIYRDGERIGEIRSEDRGGFLGFGSETVRVEYDNSGNETSYSRQEERGGFLGVGAEPQEIRYDANDNELGHSRVEERGGFLGIGGDHVRVEYDNEGNELSTTRHERRGGIVGIGSESVKVTRFVDQPTFKSSHGVSTGRTGIQGNATQGNANQSSLHRNGDAESSSEGGAFWQVIALLVLLISGLNAHSLFFGSSRHEISEAIPRIADAESLSKNLKPSFDFNSYKVATKPSIELEPRQWGNDFAVSPSGVAHFFGQPLFEPKEIEGHGDGVLLRVFLSPDGATALAFYWQIYFDESGARRGHRILDVAVVSYRPPQIVSNKLVQPKQTLHPNFDDQVVYWSTDTSKAVFESEAGQMEQHQNALAVDLSSGIAENVFCEACTNRQK